MDIQQLLNKGRSLGASDLHLIVSCPPLFRIDGSLEPMYDAPELSSEDISDIFRQVTTAEGQEIFHKSMELDFAYRLSEVGNLRCNACKQQGSISLSFRLLPMEIPTIDDLGLPAIFKDIIRRPRGLIVFTGPTGSGKSTSMAAMIQHLNETESRYVITIEDPVEYVHPNIKCAVSQRELAADTLSYASALKYVLRQDPDVILVGEIRDLETANAVLTVAETGHLILSTGHAPSAPQSVDRIVDLFPPHERDSAQARLASVLLAVFCQALVPRIGGGRVAAIEIMLANAPVKNLIREGKTHILPNTIRTHSEIGMQTLDEALVTLHNQGVIEWATVLAFCQDSTEVEKLAGRVGVR